MMDPGLQGMDTFTCIGLGWVGFSLDDGPRSPRDGHLNLHWAGLGGGLLR